jgi:hypothetical protein
VRRPLVAAGAAVVLAGAVAAAVVVWHGQTPPPLSSGDPDTVRLTAPCCPGAPPAPHRVRLADGSTATLQLIDALQENGRPAARISVLLAPGDGRSLDLHEGDQQTVGNVTVRVLRIWLVPDPTNRAVDVRVTSGGARGLNGGYHL